MASKLNKKDLYEQFKKLEKENMNLQLFLNNSEDVRNKQKLVMECQEKENEIKDDYIKKLQEILEEKNKKLEEKNKDIEECVENMEGGIEMFEKFQKQIKIKDEIIYKLEESIKLKDEIIRLHETDEWELYKKPCNHCATINMPCVCRFRDL